MKMRGHSRRLLSVLLALVMLLSLVADVEVCQMVDPQKTVRFMVPKYVLDSIGFKL